MTQRKKTSGMRHLALWVSEFENTVAFYRDLLEMEVEWQPDADNFYLTSGNDNLALHRAPAEFVKAEYQRLDHLGFILDEIEQVDLWHDFMVENEVKIKAKPRTHRDGARSFYCYDPDENVVQIIYHPPLAQR